MRRRVRSATDVDAARPTTLILDPRSSVHWRPLRASCESSRVAVCAPEDIGREVVKACRRVPKSWAPKARAALREIDDASHV